MRPLPAALIAFLAIAVAPDVARGQACCVGSSGLTPGWLANHEQALVGLQLRSIETHGTYPVTGPFYTPPPGRDFRVETSVFGTLRVLPRAQLSLSVPFTTTRRRSNGIVETKSALGDVVASARYDFIRAGESRVPGIALVAGAIIPTGVAPDEGTPLLDADVNGLGAFEGNAGVIVEQTIDHVVVNATALFGYRAHNDAAGVDQHLGAHALFLLAGGYVFDGDVALLGTASYTREGNATLDGVEADGTGYSTTQLAVLVIVPLGDRWRLRTSMFTDVPLDGLGANRPALGGATIALIRSFR